MSFLTELATELDKSQQELSAELWPEQAKPELLPVVRLLADELGSDQILAEAALAWVRMKKNEILIASLNVYYTAAQLEAMRAKLAEEQG